MLNRCSTRMGTINHYILTPNGNGIQSCRILPFALETSRVCMLPRPAHQSNFLILHQLGAAKHSGHHFRLLPDCKYHTNIELKRSWEATEEMMSKGLGPDTWAAVVEALTAILHLGNVTANNFKAIEDASLGLGVTSAELADYLLKSALPEGSRKSSEQVTVTRDAMIKALYRALLDVSMRTAL
ncbi:hypothetical protein BD324DRAFT_640191 [Kockovaella imperatae]|uniref:Myosin motor domain-containing protein n=1 Tax=Kockovaella imperatae TaxID=4999 RepID=A0A1Y1U5Q7_9TREE|nr:hypothetical protein BD324DRAFT_640191 [Kockovaella imperatae]ORX33322.1 hypothetical protein BD324DRAFT_640191 [Kockovaella imperatae]